MKMKPVILRRFIGASDLNFYGPAVEPSSGDSVRLAGTREDVEDFGGGEGEPDEAVGDDENAESAPDDQARAVKRRRNFSVGNGCIAREFARPAIPEAAEAVGDFR